jgi:hypothetical protein
MPPETNATQPGMTSTPRRRPSRAQPPRSRRKPGRKWHRLAVNRRPRQHSGQYPRPVASPKIGSPAPPRLQSSQCVPRRLRTRRKCAARVARKGAWTRQAMSATPRTPRVACLLPTFTDVSRRDQPVPAYRACPADDGVRPSEPGSRRGWVWVQRLLTRYAHARSIRRKRSGPGAMGVARRDVPLHI